MHRDNRARVARPPPHAIGLPGGFRPVATSPSVAPRLRNPCCASGVCDFRRAGGRGKRCAESLGYSHNSRVLRKQGPFEPIV